MKKYIGTLIINITLAYLGYLMYEKITNLQYAFSTVWGAVMMLLNHKIMEILY